MNNSYDVINEVRNKLDIVDVISEYIPLTKKGKNFFGVCPFHDDNNPSMSVSRELQIFRCFSCGAGGNVFTFVKDYENLTFKETLEKLAAKAGVKLIGTTIKEVPVKYQKYYDKMYGNRIHSR